MKSVAIIGTYVAAQNNWLISNSDVTAANLNTRLLVDIQIKLEGTQYVHSSDTMQVLIYGSLYGLPQSATLWYNRLVAVFIDLDYFASDMRQSLLYQIH